ncbi:MULTISPECIES: glycosyltransferase family A protein [unclassified Methylobacterium]|uniref:glycosyltransferase family 2 protein n=1 Tax=unclassified Methylobacterium TaxID=2615210 RepID=UPI002269E57C|nr:MULTISPECIES: glycosyltransferase family A protein [unclassified Methylobacterium]
MTLSPVPHGADGVPKVTFSLIVSTIGQTLHFERFLDSLVAQQFKDFEVIVIDQSGGVAIQDQLDAFRERLLIVYTTSARGLSLGRNRGLTLARGELVAFPDDDCWYKEDLLKQVHETLRSKHLDGVFGRCIDNFDKSVAGRHSNNAQLVSKHNVWKCGVSATIFIRRSAIEKIGLFDTTIGLGSETQFLSGEETDLILRGINLKLAFFYDPSIVVLHDSSTEVSFARRAARTWSYGLGMGLVLRRHQYGFLFVFYCVIRPIIGAAAGLTTGRFRVAVIRIVRAAARLEGWRRAGRADTVGHLQPVANSQLRAGRVVREASRDEN